LSPLTHEKAAKRSVPPVAAVRARTNEIRERITAHDVLQQIDVEISMDNDIQLNVSAIETVAAQTDNVDRVGYFWATSALTSRFW